MDSVLANEFLRMENSFTSDFIKKTTTTTTTVEYTYSNKCNNIFLSEEDISRLLSIKQGETEASKDIDPFSFYNTTIKDIDDSLLVIKNEEYNSSYQDNAMICVPPEHMSISYLTDIMKPKTKKIKKKEKKRTVTSYDHETSFYLKSVFFEVYSYQNKLTKKQRNEVQKRTGLGSRNITYWFSNHKRRFYETLKVYRKTIENSNGSIKNYSDFVLWRRNHGLSDQISQEEIDQA